MSSTPIQQKDTGLQLRNPNDKLDELIKLSREANLKIDKIGIQVDDMDTRLQALEARMDKLGIKAIAAGGLGGAVVAVGIEFIKLKFGG